MCEKSFVKLKKSVDNVKKVIIWVYENKNEKIIYNGNKTDIS